MNARIYKTADGQIHHEYLIRGVAYHSLEAAKAAMEGR